MDLCSSIVLDQKYKVVVFSCILAYFPVMILSELLRKVNLFWSCLQRESGAAQAKAKASHLDKWSSFISSPSYRC